MANIKSAQKRILITEKKTAVNKARKSEIKTYMHKFNAAIENENIEEAQALLKVLDRKLKRASHKGLMHRNNVSRKISNLNKRINNAIQ